MKQILLWSLLGTAFAAAVAGNDNIESNEVSQEEEKYDLPNFIQQRGHFEMLPGRKGDPIGLMHINDPECRNGCLLATASSSNVPGVSFYLDGGALMAQAGNVHMKAAIHPDDKAVEFFNEKTASMDSKLLLVKADRNWEGLLLFTTTDTLEWDSGFFLVEVRNQIKWFSLPDAPLKRRFRDDMQSIYGRRHPDHAKV